MSADFQNAIIGQTKLLNKINALNIDSLPHSILMIGDLGCGKHTLCKYIANKFYRLNGISCGFLRFVPVKCDMWRLCFASRYLDLCIVKM